MADITGTAGNDTLIGTPLDDVLKSFGGVDYLSGGDGADIYALSQGSGGSTVTIEDKGRDGAIDTITGARGLFGSASFGYLGWATAERVGNDLIIILPGVPDRFRHPGYGPLSIEITDQYAGSAVEYLEMNGLSYRLADSFLGTSENDIMAGTQNRDVIETYAGDDFVDAGAGNDKILTGAGDDTVFAGEGRNLVKTGAGSDLVYGGTGNDKVISGAGNDRIDVGDGRNLVKSGSGNDVVSTGAGDDTIRAGGGDDQIDAGDGNNRVYGGAGEDTIITGTGDDLLVGGRGGDSYVVSSFGSGHDTIIDNGSAAQVKYGWLTWNIDEVQFTGFASLERAVHSLDLQISGNDLVLTYWNEATPGVSGQITVQDHFLSGKFALEQVDFGTGGTSAIYHISQLSGDDYTYSVHGGSDAGGNDIVLGTIGDDVIFGGLGGDIMLGGGGSDRYIFHDEGDGGVSTDIILDFDITDDVLDFSDIKQLGFAGVSFSTSADGNALVSTAYGKVELVGIDASTLTEGNFAFKGTTPGGGGTTATTQGDVLVGTDFADSFVLKADTAFTSVVTIKDFLVAHGDMLDVSDLLIGFDPAVDAISDFVTLTPVPEADDMVLAVDRDGSAGAYGAQDVAIIIDAPTLDVQTLYESGLLLG